jgi:hypothetical protein
MEARNIVKSNSPFSVTAFHKARRLQGRGAVFLTNYAVVED